MRTVGVVPAKQAPPPRRWCTPARAFGQLKATTRVWDPPSGNDPTQVAEFRAAVLQNVIALYVRQHKNAQTPRLVQEGLAALDGRPDAFSNWNARLCGREKMWMHDIATLMVVLPGALPTESDVATFMDVAEKRMPPPPGWDWPDT